MKRAQFEMQLRLAISEHHPVLLQMKGGEPEKPFEFEPYAITRNYFDTSQSHEVYGFINRQVFFFKIDRIVELNMDENKRIDKPKDWKSDFNLNPTIVHREIIFPI